MGRAYLLCLSPIGKVLSIVAVHTSNSSRVSLPLAMSMPQNEQSPRKWFKQMLRWVFSCKSRSRNLDMQDARRTSTNVPPINASSLAAQAKKNSPSDGPRVIPDHTGSMDVTTSASTLFLTL